MHVTRNKIALNVYLRILCSFELTQDKMSWKTSYNITNPTLISIFCLPINFTLNFTLNICLGKRYRREKPEIFFESGMYLVF